MRRAAWLCASILLALGCSASPASAQNAAPAEAFAAGSRAFAAAEWEKALAYFEQARDAGMPGPAVRYNIGVCQYRLGRYRDAADTFRSIVDRFPAMLPLAEYNAGLALAQQEDYEGARAALRRAAAAGDDRVAGLAGAMLDRLPPGAADPAPAPAGERWTAFAEFSAGLDDNVALLDDSILPAGESTDSVFGRFFGQVRTPSRRGWQATGSAYLVRYPDAGRFEQDVLRVGAAWQGSRRQWRIEAGPHASYSTLDGAGFERRFGAALALGRSLGPDLQFAARFTIEDIADAEPQFGFVEGSRRALELQLERYVADGRFRLGYVWSADDRASASVSPVRQEFAVSYRHWFGERWSAEAATAFRSSRYDDLAVPRDEDRSELSLAFFRDLPAGWQLTGRYLLSENDSNAEGFGYSRNRFALGVNRVFR